ncbi:MULTISPECIES: PhzF family phenazine biosynthesis protein [Bacillus]|uniref:PhzF family phenazine biosynthesis protein n=1 Tax=Bacillus TaxID=1386 RepID=UPI0005D3B4D2|nr:PhzF family phenazine biosynthesis protein [Bacillus altitudinis]KQL41257.1 PhzF family phenazine biosynthesis protein [Bacillus sp. FJAT-21955]KJF46623.1 PhzF family phenazine biosynthesis protein [Bacillus altitudinis]MBU8654715.1 PhzF family phenazine biosynthesis protein [Bacillus altitudinis]MBU8780306.1 PhzF family phenazine biosynthesis protein [Bacillus altitudinis]NMF12844.1 PhzF family phenazine biosynthesis protein [Bacillus altitudinis]
MKDIRVYHVDAFTTEKFGGNAAGVVLDGEWLTEDEMQNIAKELNLPESVFLLPAHDEKADYRVKYFTPTEEVNFCGHATVGLTWLLATELDMAKEKSGVVLETKIGHVPVVWHEENGKVVDVEMTQVTPKTRDFIIDVEELSDILGISSDRIDPSYPIKLANTGNWHLLVPLKHQHDIDQAAPNLAALGKMNKEQDITTTHLYTFQSTKDCDLYTRDFAPGIGIPEDPVTGAANGALAGYLYLEGIIPQQETTHLRIAQGDAIGRPGLLRITVIPNETKPVIKVAGAAVITIRGVITL